jgi:uncharacterized membrane protein YqjE
LQRSQRRLHLLRKRVMEIDNIESRSIAEIVSDLKRDLTELVKEEVSLARVELTEKTRRFRRGAVSLVLGGVVAFAGLMALVIAAIVLLDQAIGNLWLSSAIVGFVLLLLGLVFVASARKQFEDLTPRETVESLKRSKELLEKQVAARTAGISS